ncbi:20375_t:CDS:2, partial [Racocetra persica]
MKITRESKLRKYSYKLRSGQCDIVQFTIQYLEDTVKLLNCKLKWNEISKCDYNSRIIEIEKLQTEINDLMILAKNLQDEVNSLKEKKQKIETKKYLIQINNRNENGKQIQVKNQEVINLHRRIREILEEYRQKYKRDSNIDSALSEYNMLPKSLQSDWIEKKSNFIQEYQTRILKMKHPSITNENIQVVLENTTFYFQDNYNLQDNLYYIKNNLNL